MATAQLARLQPQISALSSLFEDPENYTEALAGLLEKYRGEMDFSTAGISAYSMIKRLNIPEIVISQLGISFNHLSRSFPNQAIEIADSLWEREYFEYKLLALSLLSKLPGERIEVFFDRIAKWVELHSEMPILVEIIKIGNSNQFIRSNPIWLHLITSWAGSSDFHLAKIGLRAITDFLSANRTIPLPTILKGIQSIFLEPNIKVHAELLGLVKQLTSISMNESAAFMISLAIQNPQPLTLKFIRKCIPFFPEDASQKINESLKS